MRSKAGTTFGLAGAALLGVWVFTDAAEADESATAPVSDAPYSLAEGFATEFAAPARTASSKTKSKSKTEPAKPLPRQLVSKGGCFSVHFPSPPVFGSADKDTIVGTIEERWFLAEPTGGQFLVGYTHLPEFLVFFGGEELILNKAREVFLRREKSKQLSYTDFEIAGFKGKEVNYVRKNGVKGKAHMVFVEKRIYLVSGFTDKGMPFTDAFLKSFTLDRKCAEH